MNPKAVLSAAVSALFLAGCEGAPGADKILDPTGLKYNPAAITYTESIRDIPWASSDDHPCKPGETIAISGESHWVIHTSFDNLGGFHYKVNIVSRGKGLGSLNGTTYRINEHFKDAENAPGNFSTYIIREAMRLKVDGPTTADDYWKTTIMKITVNQAGVQEMSVESESSSCS